MGVLRVIGLVFLGLFLATLALIIGGQPNTPPNPRAKYKPNTGPPKPTNPKPSPPKPRLMRVTNQAVGLATQAHQPRQSRATTA